MILGKKKVLPKRKYHDGDLIEFNFKPDSLDVHDWQDVILAGVVTGVLYEKHGIRYKVQLRDNTRNIFGDIAIPEEQINRKIDNDIEY
jgi:hypothetical protein